MRPLYPRHPSRPTTPSPTHKTGEAVANYATRSSVHVGVATWHRHGPVYPSSSPCLHLLPFPPSLPPSLPPSFHPSFRSTSSQRQPSLSRVLFPLTSRFLVLSRLPIITQSTLRLRSRSAPPASRTELSPPLHLSPPSATLRFPRSR